MKVTKYITIVMLMLPITCLGQTNPRVIALTKEEQDTHRLLIENEVKAQMDSLKADRALTRFTTNLEAKYNNRKDKADWSLKFSDDQKFAIFDYTPPVTCPMNGQSCFTER